MQTNAIAFTLIELLVVIAIVGILVALLVPLFKLLAKQHVAWPAQAI